MALAIVTANGAPDTKPGFVGQRFIDLDSGTRYTGIGIESVDDWKLEGGVKTGNGTPTDPPDFVGQEFLDIENGTAYMAFGTASVDDWQEAGGGAAATFLDHGEVSGTVQLDYEAATVHQTTLTGDTTFELANWPEAGEVGRLEHLIVNKGGHAVTFAPEVDFGKAGEPALTGFRDRIAYSTIDGGDTVDGRAASRGHVTVGKALSVYFGTDDGTFYKVDADGNEVYYNTHLGTLDNINAIAADDEGNVYITTAGNEVRKYDVDGEHVWTFPGHGNTIKALALGPNGEVYSGDDDNILKRLDPADGSEVWSVDPTVGDVNSVAVDSDGSIYVGGGATEDSYVARLDPADGSVDWRSANVGSGFGQNEIFAIGIGASDIFALEGSGLVFRFAKDTGADTEIVSGLTTSNLSIANGLAMAADGSDDFYVVDVSALHRYQSDGTLVWDSPDVSSTTYDVAVDPDTGTVYAAMTSALLALDPADGTLIWNYDPEPSGESLRSVGLGQSPASRISPYLFEANQQALFGVTPHPANSSNLFAAAALDGKLYTVTRYADGGWVIATYAYDPATDTWTELAAPVADFESANNSRKAFTYNGLFYYFAYNATDDALYPVKYDPVADTHTGLSAQFIPGGSYIDDFSVAVVGNKLFVIGGDDGSAPVNTLKIFDLDTETWDADGASLPVTLSASEAIAFDGDIYVFGGTSTASYTYQDAIYKYDVTGDSWSAQSATLPEALAYQEALQIESDNLIYLVGGEDSGFDDTDYFMTYDPSGDTLVDDFGTLPFTTDRTLAGAIGDIIYAGRFETEFHAWGTGFSAAVHTAQQPGLVAIAQASEHLEIGSGGRQGDVVGLLAGGALNVVYTGPGVWTTELFDLIVVD